MANLIAIVFDNVEEAVKVRETLSKAQKSDYISMEDAATVVRDEDGKLHIHNEIDRGVKVGALWGSLIGLLLGGFLFPVFGLAMGVIGGAAVGKMVGESVDPKFTKEIGAAMEPGSSALFFIFRGDDVNAAIAAMRPYKGKVIHTTLSEEAEKSLRDELKSRIK